MVLHRIVKMEQVHKHKGFKRFYFLCVMAVLFLLLAGCRTTNGISKNSRYVQEENIFKYLEYDIPSTAEDTYIFIRLYEPVYSNPFYIANLLKFCVKITEVNDFYASHASIGFSLQDNFYGLTQGGWPELNVEHCTNISTNDYMSRCDVERSEQIVYALKVTPEEYNKAKRLLVENELATYDPAKIFPVATRSVKRSFFTTKKNQPLERFNTIHAKHKTVRPAEEINPEKRFVCSTFVSYILNEAVQSVHDFFEAYNIDYRYMTVTDIAAIPGVEYLFRSSWEDYERASYEFASQNTAFLPYLSLDKTQVVSADVASEQVLN